MIEEYADFFAGNDFQRLITYLKNKYVIKCELNAKLEQMGKEEEERLKKLEVCLKPTEKGSGHRSRQSARELTGTQNVNKGGPPLAALSQE